MSDSESDTDRALAERAAAGEEAAFAALISRHKAPLYRLLRRYCGDTDMALEATHEAFVAAWFALPRFDPSRPFGAWLRTIALNKGRDLARRARIRRRLFGSGPSSAREAEALADSALPAEARLIARERAATLERAIVALPSHLKGPLLLTAFEHRSQAETAAILGLTRKAVETRLRRARARLARVLDGMDDPTP